jgi:hypothetical protein
MRQLIWILTLGIASPILFAQESGSQKDFNLIGTMSCKVKAQTVIEIEEGKASKYSGFEDSWKVGDTLKVTYGISSSVVNDDIPVFRFQTHFKGKPEIHLSLSDSRLDNAEILKHTPGKVFEITTADGYKTINWGTNRITLDGLSEVRFERYYKDDWQGSYNIGLSTKTAQYLVHIVAIDCRHETNKIEEVWEYLNKQTDWKPAE